MAFQTKNTNCNGILNAKFFNIGSVLISIEYLRMQYNFIFISSSFFKYRYVFFCEGIIYLFFCIFLSFRLSRDSVYICDHERRCDTCGVPSLCRGSDRVLHLWLLARRSRTASLPSSQCSQRASLEMGWLQR